MKIHSHFPLPNFEGVYLLGDGARVVKGEHGYNLDVKNSTQLYHELVKVLFSAPINHPVHFKFITETFLGVTQIRNPELHALIVDAYLDDCDDTKKALTDKLLRSSYVVRMYEYDAVQRSSTQNMDRVPYHITAAQLTTILAGPVRKEQPPTYFFEYDSQSLKWHHCPDLSILK